VEIAEDFQLTMKINELDLPVKEEVHGVCDLLGFDPLYLANEGKAIIIVADKEKEKVIGILREFSEGRDAVIIGSIIGKQKGRLLLETPLGSKRLLTRLSGTMFPRIC
jgi:hydrogenase expression/formation protein HypE